jgi:hypothetical protein
MNKRFWDSSSSDDDDEDENYDEKDSKKKKWMKCLLVQRTHTSVKTSNIVKRNGLLDTGASLHAGKLTVSM